MPSAAKSKEKSLPVHMVFVGVSNNRADAVDKAGQNNIIVSCNPTNPWQKPPTQKNFQPFSVKMIIRLISRIVSNRRSMQTKQQ